MNKLIIPVIFFSILGIGCLGVFITNDDAAAGIWGVFNLLVTFTFCLIIRIENEMEELEPVKHLISYATVGENDKKDKS